MESQKCQQSINVTQLPSKNPYSSYLPIFEKQLPFEIFNLTKLASQPYLFSTQHYSTQLFIQYVAFTELLHDCVAWQIDVSFVDSLRNTSILGQEGLERWGLGYVSIQAMQWNAGPLWILEDTINYSKTFSFGYLLPPGSNIKFILLSQVVVTFNNYACSLPLLANVNWSAFSECFLLTM